MTPSKLLMVLVLMLMLSLTTLSEQTSKIPIQCCCSTRHPNSKLFFNPTQAKNFFLNALLSSQDAPTFIKRISKLPPIYLMPVYQNYHKNKQYYQQFDFSGQSTEELLRHCKVYKFIKGPPSRRLQARHRKLQLDSQDQEPLPPPGPLAPQDQQPAPPPPAPIGPQDQQPLPAPVSQPELDPFLEYLYSVVDQMVPYPSSSQESGYKFDRQFTIYSEDSEDQILGFMTNSHFMIYHDPQEIEKIMDSEEKSKHQKCNAGYHKWVAEVAQYLREKGFQDQVYDWLYLTNIPYNARHKGNMFQSWARAWINGLGLNLEGMDEYVCSDNSSPCSDRC